MPASPSGTSVRIRWRKAHQNSLIFSGIFRLEKEIQVKLPDPEAQPVDLEYDNVNQLEHQLVVDQPRQVVVEVEVFGVSIPKILLV